eukprot:scaffold169289_cov21-Tisochrysis_lutea.AAC.1
MQRSGATTTSLDRPATTPSGTKTKSQPLEAQLSLERGPLADMVQQDAQLQLRELLQREGSGSELRPAKYGYSMGSAGFSARVCSSSSIGSSSSSSSSSSSNSSGKRSSSSRGSAGDSQRVGSAASSDSGSSSYTQGVQYVGLLDPALWPKPIWALPLVSDFSHALVDSGMAHSWPELMRLAARVATELT